MKIKLTDAKLKNIAPAPHGKRLTVWDTEVGNFGVRVTDRVDPATNEPRRTFIVMRRLNGQLIRHKIGVYPAVTLQAARIAARDANMDFENGIDPKAKKVEAARAEAARRQVTFEVVAEEFIKRHVLSLRSGQETAASIRRVFVSRWGDKPIGDISPGDIVKMVEEIQDSGHEATARKMLAHSSKLFSWAVSRKTFGLSKSPCAEIIPRDILGKKTPRQRVLHDYELRSIWAVIEDLSCPSAPFVKMLILTGQRLRELAESTWQEFNLEEGLWTIPGSRMKGGAPHEVPLSTQAIAVLKEMPKFSATGQKAQREQFVFSTTNGLRPISGFSKLKSRIDAKLENFAPWVFHDLRRTMRTHLSGLSIEHHICELVIAHRQTQLDQIYDLHRYREEKRRALQVWGERVYQILSAASDEKEPRIIEMTSHLT